MEPEEPLSAACFCFEVVVRSRPHPEQGFRACVGILRLAKTYGGDRLDAACERALVIGTLMALGTAAMYYLGSVHVLHSSLSLGTLTVLYSYLIMLYQPLEALTYRMRTFLKRSNMGCLPAQALALGLTGSARFFWTPALFARSFYFPKCDPSDGTHFTANQ